jgi:hypothetical protein
MIERGQIVKDWGPEHIGRLYQTKYNMGPVSYDMERLQTMLLGHKEPFLKRLMFFAVGRLP